MPDMLRDDIKTFNYKTKNKINFIQVIDLLPFSQADINKHVFLIKPWVNKDII